MSSQGSCQETTASLPAQPKFRVSKGENTPLSIHKQARQLCLASREGKLQPCCFDDYIWLCTPLLLGSPVTFLGTARLGQESAPQTRQPAAARNANLLPASQRKGGAARLTPPPLRRTPGAWYPALCDGVANRLRMSG